MKDFPDNLERGYLIAEKKVMKQLLYEQEQVLSISVISGLSCASNRQKGPPITSISTDLRDYSSHFTSA